jgi:hypothetical protein
MTIDRSEEILDSLEDMLEELRMGQLPPGRLLEISRELSVIERELSIPSHAPHRLTA